MKNALLVLGSVIILVLAGNFMSKHHAIDQNRNEVLIPYLMSNRPDPFNIGWSGDWAACGHSWTTLVHHSFDGTIAPGIAKSWAYSPDGLEWRFHIKQGLKWSDGTAMTLAQIVESLRASSLGTSHSNFSSAINKIESNGNEIVFSLSRAIPSFLISLTYVDWAIVHPDSFIITDGRARLKEVEPCSGPFCLNISRSEATQKAIELTRNPYFDGHLNNLKSGRLRHYADCSELVKAVDRLLSFRAYSTALTPECQRTLEQAGFHITRTEPTWVLKADFLKRGLERLTTEQRRKMLVGVHRLLESENPKFGVSLATGIRPLNSFGALDEGTFRTILEGLYNSTAQVSVTNLPLDIVTMRTWSQWPSYIWLVAALKKIGLDVREHILSTEDFAEARKSGSLHNNYDLLFIPLGSGDPDADGNWQIANQLLYPGAISNERLSEAYFEVDLSKRELAYKQFAIDIIQKGLVITLRNDADFVGIHSSVQGTNAPPFRQGITLYDLFF